MHNSLAGLYDIPLQRLDGSTETFGTYRNRTTLVVNVASKCRFTPQYEGLERLYERHKDGGFMVLGFPCNQFGMQEPGSDEEIMQFCVTQYNISFPLFAKVDVNGPRRHPLYAALVQMTGGADVHWNFEKFLVRPGGLIERFSPETTPLGLEAKLWRNKDDITRA